MAYTKSDKGDAPMRRRGMGRRRKKVCVFCGKENNEHPGHGLNVPLKLLYSYQQSSTFSVKNLVSMRLCEHTDSG